MKTQELSGLWRRFYRLVRRHRCCSCARNYKDRADRYEADANRYRALLFEAWKSLRQQSKGLNRQARKIKRLRHCADWFMRRCTELHKAQRNMRDPERKIVCDILANGKTHVPPNVEVCRDER